MEPVKLTKEVFKKIDVAEAGNGWYAFSNEGFDFNIDSGELSFDADCDEPKVINKKPIYYLHELQNAYYFLTGREMEYKL